MEQRYNDRAKLWLFYQRQGRINHFCPRLYWVNKDFFKSGMRKLLRLPFFFLTPSSQKEYPKLL